MIEGTIEPFEGRSLVRFERRYPHPVERVWAAITEPDQLRQWWGEGDIRLDLVEGGSYDVAITGPAELTDAMIEFGRGTEVLERHDTVLQVDPPRLFEHTFHGGSVVRWELQPDGDGTLLRLTHTMTAPAGPEDASKALAGWHTMLDLLEPLLDGARQPWTRAHWDRNHEAYAGAAR